jgi:D-serine deaminase-like pyridoxal phosphate-dependent protein
MKRSEIPTPALVVDLAAMERNIARMAAHFAARQCKLRPHFKAHKTPAIASRQLAAGSCTGLTCATVGEAEVVMRDGLTRDVLIANEVVGPGKAARVAALAKHCDLIVAVDSQYGLEDLSSTASEAGVEVGVLIDVDVGMPRCGVAHGAPAVELARAVERAPGVRLRGLMGYEGHVMRIRDRAEREARATKSMDRLLTTAKLVREAGLRCDIVSAGGTCTFDITGNMEGITEVQAGTYVLMDAEYLYEDLPFELAFSLLCTVISRPVPERCVADGGLKASSIDHGSPEVSGVKGAAVLYLADEHTIVTLPSANPLAPGDRIAFRPTHIDPTINLHDVLYAVDGDEVVEVWPIAARGYPAQRGAVG